MYESIYKPNQIVRVKTFPVGIVIPRHWVAEMKKNMSKIVSIRKLTEDGLLLNNIGFIWEDNDFEKVNKNV